MKSGQHLASFQSFSRTDDVCHMAVLLLQCVIIPCQLSGRNLVFRWVEIFCDKSLGEVLFIYLNPVSTVSFSHLLLLWCYFAALTAAIFSCLD